MAELSDTSKFLILKPREDDIGQISRFMLLPTDYGLCTVKQIRVLRCHCLMLDYEWFKQEGVYGIFVSYANPIAIYEVKSPMLPS